MKILYFLADHVFRFRYRDPNTGPTTWDIGIYEEEQDKTLRDFFLMGVSITLIVCVVVGGVICWIV